MNIPTITDIATALRVYYENSELSNKEIKELFGSLSSATVARLKKRVKEEMINQNVPAYGLNKVNTKIAYEMWGIDVLDLEKRIIKLRSLGLTEKNHSVIEHN